MSDKSVKHEQWPAVNLTILMNGQKDCVLSQHFTPISCAYLSWIKKALFQALRKKKNVEIRKICLCIAEFLIV